jgi:predicted ABC-type ATPase
MPVPRLFIVAGPNGSGKSLFSRELTQVDFEVFDGDKYMSRLISEFPETGSEALWSHINDYVFIEEKQKAISAGANFTFETNFSNDTPLTSAREFSDKGYEIHLIFMGLSSLEESMQRVAYRVRAGGHKISEESIRYNYEHGFKNLYKHFRQFDSVTLFDNSIANIDEPVIPKEILHITNGILYLQTTVYPEWVKPIIDSFDQLKNFNEK